MGYILTATKRKATQGESVDFAQAVIIAWVACRYTSTRGKTGVELESFYFGGLLWVLEGWGIRGSRWPERVAGIGRGSNSSIEGKKGGNSRKISHE